MIQNLLGQIFQEIGFRWEAVLKARRDLAQLVDAYSLFAFFDNGDKAYVVPDDLAAVIPHHLHIQAFFHHYSILGGRLTQNQFIWGVQDKGIFDNNQANEISKQIIESFAQLLRCQHSLFAGIRDIAETHSASLLLQDSRAVFHLIDNAYFGFISKFNLQPFAVYHHLKFDPEAIVDCMDLKGNGTVNLEEFKKFFHIKISRKKKTLAPCTSNTPKRTNYRQVKSVKNHLERMASVNNLKEICLHEVGIDLSKQVEAIKRAAHKIQCIQDRLKSQAQRLCQCKDFNPGSLFEFLDISRKGEIIASELKQSLSKIGVEATYKECSYFIKAIAKTKPNKIFKKDFLKIFPKQNLNVRTSVSKTTALLIQQFFLIVLNSFTKLQQTRAKQKERLGIKVQQLWDVTEEQGVLRREQVWSVFPSSRKWLR